MDLKTIAECGGHVLAEYIMAHDKEGILEEILPEIAVLKKFKHCKGFHPESEHVFGHVMCALKASKSKDYRVILSILFHDIGKALTHKWNEEKGRDTYYGHDMAGTRMMHNHIGKKYGFDEELIDIIAFCCAQHMRYHELDKMRDTKKRAILDHKYYDILKEVAFADSSARHQIFKDHNSENIIS